MMGISKYWDWEMRNIRIMGLVQIVVHRVVVVVYMYMLLQHSGSGRVNGEGQVPCVFVFGDSLSDSGNNNQLSTLAKANYLPYGLDFPSGPTGRFTNGRTTLDIISTLSHSH